LQALSAVIDDVEKEAKAYFESIYEQRVSLPQAVETLRRFKNSSLKRERDMYACMIHNLFDEYRFFHQYPPTELRITGTLFGLLIQHKLVSSFTLGVALKYVLEALRQSADSEMFKFGVWALMQYKERLYQWQQYCELIAQIPHLRTEQPELSAFLAHVLQTLKPAGELPAPSPLQPTLLNAPKVDKAAEAVLLGPSIADLAAEQAAAEQAMAQAARDQELILAAEDLALANQVNELMDETPPANSSMPPVAPLSTGVSTGPVLDATPSMAPISMERILSDSKDTVPAVASSNSNRAAPTATGAFGSALNIDTLLSVERSGPPPPAPSDAIKDKIHFIVNNVSKHNMHEKSKKLKAILEEQYYPYFSRYLVVKRVSTEANFQKLYAEFLDHVRVSKLEKQLVETTYEYIKVLLNSDKVLTSSSERSLLKNLGSWLGLLTIAKNKAVRANRLHIKGLVLQAYEAGRLIAVIPFVAKILESCSKSKVFKPPNPWLMALVGVLKEIFELPDLKLNLKFEIEVLFNNLSINMKDVTTYGLLKDRAPKTGAAFNNISSNANLGKSNSTSAPFARASGPNTNPSLRAPETTAARTAATDASSYPTQGGTDGAAVAGADANGSADAQFSGDQATIIPNLPAYVNIHPSIALFSMYPHLKRLVPTAIDRAIREIITPVVERSVTIACVTTRELVMKDFAMEPDENKMRKAAHQMVQKLTSSLAEVTCKEPLRVSINNHLGSLLEANAQSAERTLVEHACTQISTDNLELGIKLIDKAASDRAVREIEESLGPMFSIRQKHREQTGQPYYDMSVFAGNARFPNSLPDPLRPKPGGLSATQLCVYDDFSSIPTHQQMQAAPQTKADPKVEPADSQQMQAVSVPSRPSAQHTPARSGSNTPTTAPRSPVPPSSATAATGAPLTSQQTLDKLIGCLASLEQAVARFPNYKNTPLSSLPSVGARGDHEIHVLLRMIPTILNQCPRDEATFPRDVVAFTFAHKAFKRLYERDNRHSLLQIDVHIQVLKCIRGICPKIVKELTSWLLFSDDERKYLIQITTGLLRARMLHIPDVDMYLAKLVHGVHASGQALQTRNNLSQNLHPHLEFVISLVSRTVVKEPVLAVQELPHLFDALSKMLSVTQRRNKPVAEVLGHLLQEVRAAAPPPAGGGDSEVPTPPQPQAQEQSPAQQPQATAQPQASPAQPQAQPQTSQESQLEARADVGNVVDESTAALLAEEAIMDRKAWDDEPASFRQQVVHLLDDWMNICLQGTASDQMIAQYLSVLQQQRVLATPESTSRFFLIITQLCVDSAFSAADKAQAGAPASQPVQLSYTAIDALAKLVVFLVKFFAGGEATANAGNPNAPKVRMLSAFLHAACRVLRRDADMSGRGVRSGKGPGNFNQRPYFRLLANLLHHLNTPDPSLDSNNVDVLMAFGHCFRLLRPSRVPSFCFAWLELIAHRMFMSKLLICKSHQCTVLFEHLLVDLLDFMQPYLRNANLTDSVRMLYKGTLRVLLVLLHDFPEFLCEFHFSFCNVIPPTCIQMRNLILSAFPRSMRLPDPFTPNLKVCGFFCVCNTPSP
jgi:CCR4-NOT transcription complex subunit 1